MKNNTDALDKQVGGVHYKKHKLQPIELAYILGATPGFCKVSKYTTREKDSWEEQIEKAIHCVELEQSLHKHRSLYTTKDLSFSWYWICIFTDNQELRYALQAMYHEQYEYSISYLKNYLKEKTNDNSQ